MTYLCRVNLLFFNFSHDLALANGQGNYVSPLLVRTMEADLMPLAAFCASAGDAVVVADGCVERCKAFYASLCRGVNFVSPTALPADFHLQAWGLDAHLFWSLSRCGAMVGDKTAVVDEVRRLSSRRVAVEVLGSLRRELCDEPLCGESVWCADMASVTAAVGANPHSVLKAPWSGSGRGLRFADGDIVPPVSGWCNHILASQGGLVVEPLYQKEIDLAAEFMADTSGRVRFVGLSSFLTSDRSTYLGNLVASQDLLRKLVFGTFSEEVFNRVVACLERLLSEKINGRYVGPIGVDMMICREGNSLLLHPCVEMNVRTTMGLLAMKLVPLLGPGVSAVFHIRYDEKNEQLCRFMDRFQKPCLNADGGLVSGHLLLTPFHEDAHYISWLEVGGR